MAGETESDEPKGGGKMVGCWILVVARAFLSLGWPMSISREPFAHQVDHFLIPPSIHRPTSLASRSLDED